MRLMKPLYFNMIVVSQQTSIPQLTDQISTNKVENKQIIDQIGSSDGGLCVQSPTSYHKMPSWRPCKWIWQGIIQWHSSCCHCIQLQCVSCCSIRLCCLSSCSVFLHAAEFGNIFLPCRSIQQCFSFVLQHFATVFFMPRHLAMFFFVLQCLEGIAPHAAVFGGIAHHATAFGGVVCCAKAIGATDRLQPLRATVVSASGKSLAGAKTQETFRKGE